LMYRKYKNRFRLLGRLSECHGATRGKRIGGEYEIDGQEGRDSRQGETRSIREWKDDEKSVGIMRP